MLKSSIEVKIETDLYTCFLTCYQMLILSKESL